MIAATAARLVKVIVVVIVVLMVMIVIVVVVLELVVAADMKTHSYKQRRYTAVEEQKEESPFRGGWSW
jgi:NADH:ubiquinone oxidoreductase subunit 3 (subunit A)